jgi:cytoskeletal protein CcmA (bactofilin family)
LANSVIEEDLTIEGDIRSEDGQIEVKGQITGDVTALSVSVTQNGAIKGALTAKSISIDGRHNGSLTCEDLTLASSCTVQADISAKTLSTQSGARVAGSIQISGR